MKKNKSGEAISRVPKNTTKRLKGLGRPSTKIAPVRKPYVFCQTVVCWNPVGHHHRITKRPFTEHKKRKADGKSASAAAGKKKHRAEYEYQYCNLHLIGKVCDHEGHYHEEGAYERYIRDTDITDKLNKTESGFERETIPTPQDPAKEGSSSSSSSHNHTGTHCEFCSNLRNEEKAREDAEFLGFSESEYSDEEEDKILHILAAAETLEKKHPPHLSDDEEEETRSEQKGQNSTQPSSTAYPQTEETKADEKGENLRNECTTMITCEPPQLSDIPYSKLRLKHHRAPKALWRINFNHIRDEIFEAKWYECTPHLPIEKLVRKHTRPNKAGFYKLCKDLKASPQVWKTFWTTTENRGKWDRIKPSTTTTFTIPKSGLTSQPTRGVNAVVREALHLSRNDLPSTPSVVEEEKEEACEEEPEIDLELVTPEVPEEKVACGKQTIMDCRTDIKSGALLNAHHERNSFVQPRLMKVKILINQTNGIRDYRGIGDFAQDMLFDMLSSFKAMAQVRCAVSPALNKVYDILDTVEYEDASVSKLSFFGFQRSSRSGSLNMIHQVFKSFYTGVICVNLLALIFRDEVVFRANTFTKDGSPTTIIPPLMKNVINKLNLVISTRTEVNTINFAVGLHTLYDQAINLSKPLSQRPPNGRRPGVP